MPGRISSNALRVPCSSSPWTRRTGPLRAARRGLPAAVLNVLVGCDASRDRDRSAAADELVVEMHGNPKASRTLSRRSSSLRVRSTPGLAPPPGPIPCLSCWPCFSFSFRWFASRLPNCSDKWRFRWSGPCSSLAGCGGAKAKEQTVQGSGYFFAAPGGWTGHSKGPQVQASRGTQLVSVTRFPLVRAFPPACRGGVSRSQTTPPTRWPNSRRQPWQIGPPNRSRAAGEAMSRGRVT